MALIKFNDYVPVRFNSLVDELLNESLPASGSKRSYRPAADILENEAAFEINLVLPGISKKDIEININEGLLTVKTSRNDEHDGASVKFHLKETTYGTFERSFKLPENVKEDEIKANLKNGILSISIPKDKEKPLKRTIAIG